MAYAEKYNLTFVDNKSVTWRIGILKNGYVGSSSGITGQDSPLSINWQGSKLFEEIRASEATLHLISTTNFQFSEFFTADATDYILEIKKNGSLFWNGIYIPENYNEPYIDFPYPVTIRFQDGLAYLKKIKFTVSLTLSKQTIVSVINDCLDKLPSQISKNVYEVVNIFEQSMTLDPNIYGAFFSIYINPNHFTILNNDTGLIEGMSCYSVLKMLMHDNGCTLYQWNNKWYVFRIEEAINSTVNYFIFLSSGVNVLSLQKTITNRDEGNPNELIWMYRSAELNITEKFNEIIANYKYVWGNKNPSKILPPMNVTTTDNSTRNHSESWLESSALLTKTTGWYYTKSKLDYDTSNFVKEYEPDPIGDPVDEDLSPPQIVSLGGLNVDKDILTSTLDSTLNIKALENPSSSITKKGFPHYANDRIIMMLTAKYTIKVDISNIGLSFVLTYGIGLIYFKLKIGNYYLVNSATGGYEWTLTDSIARIDTNLTKYYITELTSTSLLIEFWMDEPEEYPIRLEFPAFPVTGNDDLIFTLYSPVIPELLHGGTDKITERTIFSIERLMLFYKSTTIETGLMTTTKNLIDSSFKNPLVVNVLTGDGPNFATTGSYFTASGTAISGNWYGDEDIYTMRSHIESFILRPYGRFFGKYRKNLTGTLYGNIEMFNTLIDNSIIYFINSMNYDVKKNEFEVDLVELSGTPSGTITTIKEIEFMPLTGSTNAKHTINSYNDNPTTMDVSTLTNQTGIISEVAKVPRVNNKVTLDKDINDYPL